MELVRWLVLKA